MKESTQTQPLRIAAFINPTFFVERIEAIDIIKNIPSNVQVFWGSKNINHHSAGNFFTGAEAHYADFDYVFVFNFLPKESYEGAFVYLNRQEYALKNLLGSSQRIQCLIQILDQSPYEGMLCVPMDYVKAMNWEMDEIWADHYQSIADWKKANFLHVHIDKNKMPIVAENGCALVKTSAAAGFDKLEFREMSPVQHTFASCLYRFSFALPLYIQHCGKMPAYVLCPKSASNLLVGYEAHTDLIEKVATTKSVYFEKNRAYVRKVEQDISELLAYSEKLEHDIRETKTALTKASAYIGKIESNQAQSVAYIEKLESELAKERTLYQNAAAELQNIKERYMGLLNSTSWKITGPLRKIAALAKGTKRRTYYKT